jgi:fucose permease
MQNSNSKIVLIVACAIFCALGVLTAVNGPLLAEFASLNHTSLAEIGVLFSALFAGALVSQLFSGPLSDRIGQKPVLLVGIVLMVVGVTGYSFTRVYLLTLLFALLAGFGHGAVDLGGNVMIARVFKGRSVSALNLLNLFFGLGAFAGPAMVSLSLKLWQTGLPAIWVGAAVLALPGLWLLRINLADDAADASKPTVKGTSVYRSPLLWLFATVLLLYVGTENGIGGWATIYFEQSAAMLTARAALVTSGFWLALTAGRLVSAALGARLAPAAVLLASLAEAAAGAVLLAVSHGQAALSVVAVMMIGFGFGAVYPTMIAITTETFSHGPGKAASVVAAMGSVGGLLIPWLQGVVIEKTNTQVYTIFVGLLVIVMLGISLSVYRRADNRVQVAAPQKP